jgi:hypothetical protein
MRNTIRKILKEQGNGMKNILFFNHSHDGGNHVLITDLDLLEDGPEKEAIITAVNGGSGDFGDEEGVYQLNHWDPRGYNVIDGEIVDNEGYSIINKLYNIYGHPTPPFSVEHVVHCKSDI